MTARVAPWVMLATPSLAVPVAAALARSRFAGRGLVLGLMLSPMVTNFVVLGFARIVLCGDQGLVNCTLVAAGLPALRLLYSEAAWSSRRSMSRVPMR